VWIVVWKTRGVVATDFGGTNDLFVKLFFVGGERHAQSTDVHYRLATGAASFNWRVKLPVTLPLPTAHESAGTLVVQCSDQDLVTAEVDGWFSRSPLSFESF
jgi:hypothetical protein